MCEHGVNLGVGSKAVNGYGDRRNAGKEAVSQLHFRQEVHGALTHGSRPRQGALNFALGYAGNGTVFRDRVRST